MTIKKGFAGSLMLALALGATASASAQPAAGGATGGNPTAPGDWQNWGKMTPQQRQQMVQRMVQQTLQGSLTHIGVTDEKTQTTILQFVTAQEKTTQAVRDRARKVVQALTAGDALTNPQMEILLSDFREVVETARAERGKAIAALDTQVGFSKNARLQALLTVLGLISDESFFMQGVAGNFLNAMSTLAEVPVAGAAGAGNNGNQ